MFPISTNAPVYHWPFATVGIIVANFAVFIMVLTGDITPSEGWVLEYGNGMHPQQWVLSAFMHYGPLHLVGNMLFLWILGLVIEGKLGWWKFSILYLAIALVQSAGEQFVMLGSSSLDGGSVGASAVIFGLMAIACVWAPKNEVTIVFVIYIRWVRYLDVSIAMFALFYVCWEILMVMLLGASASSALLHLSGAVIGLVMGIAMLKLNWVNCDGWDIFSTLAGHEGESHQERKKKKHLEKAMAPVHFDGIAATAQVKHYLHEENPAGVLTLLGKLQEAGNEFALEQQDLLAFIHALHKKKLWKDSAPLMAQYLLRFEKDSLRMRLTLAQICITKLSRPAKGLELLLPLEDTELPDDLQPFFAKLLKTAERNAADGELEVDIDGW